jgi:hypothetical protein
MESRFGDGIASSPFSDKAHQKTEQVKRSGVIMSPMQTTQPAVIVAPNATVEKRSAETPAEAVVSDETGAWITTAVVGTGMLVAAGVAVGVAVHNRHKNRYIKDDVYLVDGEKDTIVYDQEYGGEVVAKKEVEDEDF